jgi:hypothetical protein
MTIRYGRLMFGRRSVESRVTETTPRAMIMITITRMVNGFLTLNFSISSKSFASVAAESGQ